MIGTVCLFEEPYTESVRFQKYTDGSQTGAQAVATAVAQAGAEGGAAFSKRATQH